MTRDPRLHALDPLIGTWDTTITMLEADRRAGAVSSATDIYRWAPGNGFVLHDVDAIMGGSRVQSIEIIALDPGGTGYDVRAYEQDGTFADYEAERTGLEWNITGKTLRFRGRFSADEKTLTGQWDESFNGAWNGLMSVVLQKRA